VKVVRIGVNISSMLILWIIGLMPIERRNKMTVIFPTVDEVETFFTCWRGIVRDAAGAEVCAAIDAVFNTPPPEVEPWTDWTWADAQAEAEANIREPENFARRVVGEPEVDPWEFANTRAYVEAVIEQVFAMVENGQTIILKNKKNK
jgi:hypothetical protein